MLAVGEHEDAELYAAEVFLYDHAGAGGTELAGQHVAQVRLGGVEVVLYEDALAGRQPVGLQDVRGLQGVEEGLTLLQGLGGEGAVLRGGYLVARHEGLGVVLAAFKHSPLAARANDHDVLERRSLGEMVGDAGHKRRLGAYDEHLYMAFDGEAFHFGEVLGVELHVLAHLRGAGVAGGYIQSGAALALRYLCGYGVLAAASAKEKNVHDK